MTEMQIDRPLQCVVSDMTAFYVKGIYYELTLYMDLHITGESPVEQEVAAYITFFNTARPAYSLKYLTPQQYKEAYAPKDFATGVSAGS